MTIGSLPRDGVVATSRSMAGRGWPGKGRRESRALGGKWAFHATDSIFLGKRQSKVMGISAGGRENGRSISMERRTPSTRNDAVQPRMNTDRHGWGMKERAFRLGLAAGVYDLGSRSESVLPIAVARVFIRVDPCPSVVSNESFPSPELRFYIQLPRPIQTQNLCRVALPESRVLELHSQFHSEFSIGNPFVGQGPGIHLPRDSESHRKKWIWATGSSSTAL
jgi:hypothetical protein